MALEIIFILQYTQHNVQYISEFPAFLQARAHLRALLRSQEKALQSHGKQLTFIQEKIQL